VCFDASAVLCRVDKKRDKLERKVLDSQERAFWDVHRPAVSHSLSLSVRLSVRLSITLYIVADVALRVGVGG